jgi:hypothetical protein
MVRETHHMMCKLETFISGVITAAPGTNILGVRREKPMLEMTPPTWQLIAMCFKSSVVYPI